MAMQKMGCFDARRSEIIPFLVCICISRHSLRTDLFSWVGGYGRALIIGSYSISITSGIVLGTEYIVFNQFLQKIGSFCLLWGLWTWEGIYSRKCRLIKKKKKKKTKKFANHSIPSLILFLGYITWNWIIFGLYEDFNT